MPGSADPFDLQRFVDAQDRVYGSVTAELRAGCKRTHWIWFIFPQLTGLGSSVMAVAYGISSLGEARAYLAHDLLGPRLRECTGLVNGITGRSIAEIFGPPDDLKVRSSMTLFAHSTADNGDFRALLDRYCAGEEDQATLDLLARRG
ncbi:DUF1810 domain-containing protein [Mycobacterium sp. M1]|uniref:DUF1810 domain-containing protein n=1 Tax=Mycolicibacter acidiphilus TaxID=2835306 RepID=A0ABS5REL1_9MYCO|nr:DUF1810 domain-containing protein [Mycolicibacter acidiphilus]MBS9532717.1 DUF1810 domain-containing protein [Mycolicibacter acidiphilus]